MATLDVQSFGRAGLAEIVMAAATAGGDEVPGGTFAGGWHLPVVLLVRNENVAARDVTVGALDPVTVPPSAVAAIPVAPGVPHGDLVPITYSAVVDVTVAAIGA